MAVQCQVMRSDGEQCKNPATTAILQGHCYYRVCQYHRNRCVNGLKLKPYQPRLKLKRGQRGGVGWEIKAPWERGIANQEQREMQARVKEKQEIIKEEK